MAKKSIAQGIYNDALQELTKSIRTSKKSVADFMSFVARFHKYSFQNALLIYAQKKDATLVAGFKKWQQVNRRVKKGEKGIAIFAPYLKKNDETGDKELVGFFTVYVFDISQTEGEPLPEPPKLIDSHEKVNPKLMEASLAAAKTLGFTVTFETGLKNGARGYVTLNDRKIVIRKSLPEAERLVTLYHELGHGLLHVNHKDEGLPNLKQREVEAEAVSFIVSKAAGLLAARNVDNFTKYMAVYGGDENSVKDYFGRIVKASSKIISTIEKETNDIHVKVALTNQHQLVLHQ